MKKGIACILSAGIILLTMAGCASQSKTPEQVLQSYVAALKTQDTEAIQKYSVNETTSSSSILQTSSDASESKNGLTLMYSKVEITPEGKAEINGNTATIKAKVTAPDGKKIMQNYMATAFGVAMSNALSSSQMSSEATESATTKMFEDEYSKKDVAMTSTETKIEFIKSNGEWKVKVTDGLIDATTGGMVSYTKSIALSSSQTN